MGTSTRQIKVVLAEDHHVVRSAFAALLMQEPDIEIVGEVARTDNVIDKVKETEPNVLILDAHMPGERVINVAKELRELYPDVRILVLSAYEQSEYVVGLVRAGAAGYVLKHDSSDMLVTAVRAVAQGEGWLSPRVAGILARSVRNFDERPSPKLTDREIEVLCLMSKGMRNDEIAKALVITTQTVKNHIRHIFRKLEVETRVDAVLYALDQGLDDVLVTHD
jgi:DNA-binding NarL/FixJ family response regulator